MKRNILYIIWSLGLGGAEQVVIKLAKGLDKNCYNAFVCCLNEEGPFAPQLQDAGVPVFALHKKGGLDISVIAKIRRLIRENKIDLVHTHLWGASVWGRIAAAGVGVPVVVTEHNVDVWKSWYHKLIDRLLAPWMSRMCAVSRTVKDFYVREVGIPQTKIEVVYNGIESSLFSAHDDTAIKQLRSELGIEGGVPVLVNIGRLVPAKANHIFIESLRILSGRGWKFCAVIIGDGSLREELMGRNRDLMEKGLLKFTGLRKDVDKILDLADVSVLSSTREGLSVVVLECMAKGIPFVATDVGGNGELIADGRTGFLVPRGDCRAMADAVEKILKDSELARRMGEEARKIVREKFSLEKMLKQTQEIYETVMREHHE